MTIEQVEKKMTELVHREPFIPFVVELLDGESLVVPHPPAFDNTGAVYFGSDGALVDFEFKNVHAIRFLSAEAIA